MNETYPSTFCDQPVGPPTRIDQTRLRMQGYRLLTGLNVNMAQQLVEASREDHIVAYCPNDANEHFSSVASIEAWLRKGRLAIPLVTEAAGEKLKLAGFGWIGPAQPSDEEVALPGAELTFGIRLYKEALGKKLAFPYTLAILATNKALYSNKGVWLSTRSDNVAAVKTYEKAGFVKAAEVQAESDELSYSRIYMMLGKWALA